MRKLRGLRGSGKALTAQRLKLHLRKNWWARILPIGGKNGSKRHLQVDERGAPLALVITGANVHDAKGLPELLNTAIVVRPEGEEEHLCLDAGYVGEPIEKLLIGKRPNYAVVYECRPDRIGLAAKFSFQRRGVSRWTSAAGWESIRWRTSTR